MKGFKISFLLIAILSAFTIILTGCGGGGGGGGTTYQEPEPMPAPVTKQISVDVSLPQGSSLNNETLKIVSFYGTSYVPTKAQRLYKTIPITVTDTSKGQIVILVDSQDNPLFFSYLEATTGTATINSEGIAKALIWMNPYVMVLPADKKKEFMDKAITSTLFPQLKDKIDNLLVTDPKNLFNPDTHPELVKTAFAIVKETFEKLGAQSPKTYKDIGESGNLRVLDKSGNDVSFENPKMTTYGIELIDSSGSKKNVYLEGKDGLVSVNWEWPPTIEITKESSTILLEDGRYNVSFYKGFTTGGWKPVIPKEWLTPIPTDDIVFPGATIAATATWANSFDVIGIIIDAVTGIKIDKRTSIGRIVKNIDKMSGLADVADAIRKGDPFGTLTAFLTMLKSPNNWEQIAKAIWGSITHLDQNHFLKAANVLVKNIAKVLQAVDWANHHIPFIYDLGFAPWKVEYCVEQTGGVLNECYGVVPLIPPTASLTVSPTNPYVGDTVTFDASGSTDDRTTTLQYRFDFDGDVNWDSNWSTSNSATFAYSTKGTYNAKVEVKDEDGLTAIANYYVTVYERGKGISVALVVDRSGSMAGPNYDEKPLADAKSAVKAYVGYMGTADRGALVSFSTSVTIDQPFTDNKSLISALIDTLTASGSTAFYDAVYTAITETAKEDPNRRRAIIVLTDGADNNSVYKSIDREVSIKKFQDVVDYAKQVGIPIYTLGLAGYSYTVDTENMLKDLATQTNGLYFYAPDSSQLKSIYDTIAGIQ